MASDWPSDTDDVMRGLFGGIVGAASEGRSAANMWDSIKSQANNWAIGQLSASGNDNPTDDEVAQKAQELIGHVTVTDVNRYAQLAGQFLRARDNLQSAGVDAQITADSIFRAPWATTTGNRAVPERFRITVARTISYTNNPDEAVTEWRTYELSGPLTTAQDALEQAQSLFDQADYNASKTVNSVDDYNIEAV